MWTPIPIMRRTAYHDTYFLGLILLIHCPREMTGMLADGYSPPCHYISQLMLPTMTLIILGLTLSIHCPREMTGISADGYSPLCHYISQLIPPTAMYIHLCTTNSYYLPQCLFSS